MTQKTKRIIYGIAAATIAPLLAAGAISCGTTTPAAPAAGASSTADERAESAQNVRLVGYNDLQGRESLVVTTMSDQANGSWVYVGHHESYLDDKPKMNPITGKEEWNGTSILNVDDPSNPKLVWHIPNDSNRNSRGVSVVYDYKFDGSGRDYLIRNSEALTEGETGTDLKYQIFDITDRATDPSKITLVSEITGTPPNSCGPGCGGKFIIRAHKGWWSPVTGYFYAASGEPGFRNVIVQIFDLGCAQCQIEHLAGCLQSDSGRVRRGHQGEQRTCRVGTKLLQAGDRLVRSFPTGRAVRFAECWLF